MQSSKRSEKSTSMASKVSAMRKSFLESESKALSSNRLSAKVITATYDILHLYKYEPRPFIWSKDLNSQHNQAVKICIHPPESYKDYNMLDRKLKKAEYTKLIAGNQEFQRYAKAIATRDCHNSANEEHLQECVKMCDELGAGYDEFRKGFKQALSSYGGRDKYYWEDSK